MNETKTSETSKMPKHPNVEISVKNFGPIAEATIDLHPLTVFVGPSNTGKTYFSTLIYALHGIFDGFSRLPLPETFRSWAKIHYGSRNDLSAAFAASEEETQQIVHTLGKSDKPFKFSDLPPGIRELAVQSLKDSKLFGRNLEVELGRCFDIDSMSEIIQRTDSQTDEMKVALKVHGESQDLWNFNIKTTKSDITVDGALNENMVFLTEDERLAENGGNLEELLTLCPEIFPGLNVSKRERYYLPAARSGIMQSHRVIASSVVGGATRAGLAPLAAPTFSGVIADFMRKLILHSETTEPDERVTYLADTLESNVLAGQILIKPVPGGYPEFLYHPKQVEEEVRLTRVSSMVSELAPLVLFLRGGIRPGDTLIIEEPEAHLHPGAQTEIALTLAGLVRAGVRVVVTTHSDWFLKEIANLIRIGELKRKGVQKVEKMAPAHWLLPEEVGTWWFQKDGIVKHIPFDPTEGIEPKDYEDVAYKLYDRSVNLQDLLEKVNGG